MELRKVVVLGSARYVPERIMTNHDFEKFLDTTDEWIVQRTGIRERHFRAEGECASSMAITVGKKLLAQTGVDPKDIGLVILPTVTPDYMYPPTAVIVAAKLGCVNASGWDIEGACAGFIDGLYTAWSALATGDVKYVLLIGSEIMTMTADYTDRATCVLFGDASAGVLLKSVDESEYGVEGIYLGSDGTHWKSLYQPAGGCVKPTSHETIEKGEHFMKMEGQSVFKQAVKTMVTSIERVLEKTDTPIEDIDYFIGHQANARIIESTRRKLKIPEEKMYVNIDRYGNTTSATIPLCIDELREAGKLKPGTQLVLFTFGAGFVWGGAHLVWGS
ncbi:ketoacyl-ACP synthase III [bacterium]|nr:ketoacyl-ACP synthase III [bacterium]